MCLEEVAGGEVGGEVGGDELFVLSAGLFVATKKSSVSIGSQRQTSRRIKKKRQDVPRRCLFPSDRSNARKYIPPNCAVPKCLAQH